MKQIGAYEAKVHLGQLLDLVQAGETLEITRHGVPIARLVPADAGKGVPAKHSVEQLMAFGKGRSLIGFDVDQALHEVRR